MYLTFPLMIFIGCVILQQIAYDKRRNRPLSIERVLLDIRREEWQQRIEDEQVQRERRVNELRVRTYEQIRDRYLSKKRMQLLGLVAVTVMKDPALVDYHSDEWNRK